MRSVFSGPSEVALRLLLSTIGCAAIAAVTQPFTTWDNLTNKSTDIVIVRCARTPQRLNVQSDGVVVEIKDGLISSEIQVVAVLKGRTNLGPAVLVSRYWPRQSDQYLVFSYYQDGSFMAVERYRVVPLGIDFPTNVITGKSMEEQIQAMLRYRLDQLNHELEEQQAEKNRLEQGLKR